MSIESADYTNAYDYIRSLAGYNQSGTKLSRADAALIVTKISELANLDKENIVSLLADAQKSKTQEDFDNESRQFMEARWGI